MFISSDPLASKNRTHHQDHPAIAECRAVVPFPIWSLFSPTAKLNNAPPLRRVPIWPARPRWPHHCFPTTNPRGIGVAATVRWSNNVRPPTKRVHCCSILPVECNGIDTLCPWTSRDTARIEVAILEVKIWLSLDVVEWGIEISDRTRPVDMCCRVKSQSKRRSRCMDLVEGMRIGGNYYFKLWDLIGSI